MTSDADTGLVGRNTVLLVNAAAGGGHAGEVWRQLLAARPELGRATVLLTTTVEEAEERLTRQLARGVDRVVAVGGDGTVHWVAGCLLAGRHRVALGLVPAGTGSDLARNLGLPRQPAAALRLALTAPPRTIDVIAVEPAKGPRRFAVNVASLGLSGAVARKVGTRPAGSSRMAGRLSYLTATVGALWGFRPPTCRVVADGETLHDREIFLAAVANGRAFGQGMPVAPRARLDDGLLDVVIVPPIATSQLPLRLPQFLAGRHLDLPFVTWRRATQVTLVPGSTSAGPPCLGELDGEPLPAGAVTFQVLPSALRVLAPVLPG